MQYAVIILRKFQMGKLPQEILSLSLTRYIHRPSYCQDPDMCSRRLINTLASQGCKTGQFYYNGTFAYNTSSFHTAKLKHGGLMEF